MDLQPGATGVQMLQVEAIIEQNISHANDIQQVSQTLQQINDVLPDEVQINTNTFNVYKIDTPDVQGIGIE